MADNQVQFDFELSKTKYMEYIKKCFADDSSHHESIIQKTIMTLKGPDKTHLHKYYELSYEFGREILIEKQKTPTNPQVQVLTFEDIFDIFMKFHIASNHMGGHRYLSGVEKNMKTLYNYPSVCLSLLVKSCNVCRSRNIKPVKPCIKIGSVYIGVMAHYPGGKSHFCSYVLIYIDKSTDFVVLRPLRQKFDLEAAMEIFKILMQFGPPQKLCLHGYNIDFNKRVAAYLRKVCPMFNFSIEYRSVNLEPFAYVFGMLREWVNSKNGSTSWDIGCSVVQKALNMDVKLKPRRAGENENLSSSELFYGRVAKSTLPDSSDAARIKAASKLNLFEMHFKAKPVSKSTTGTTPEVNQEIIKLDDDVVELRIPNTEKYNTDLLNQFEDSEASQDHDGAETQLIITKTEPEDLVMNDNETENRKTKEVSHIPKVLALLSENDDKVLEIDDKLISLDLEVDDDQHVEEEEEEEEEEIEPEYLEKTETNKRRSLRLSKKIDDSKITEWIEEKGNEIVVEDSIETNEDPLNMD